MRLIRILYCECMSSQAPFNDKQLLPHVTSLSFVEAYYDINLNWTLNNCYGRWTETEPNRPFRNFGASKSVAQSSKTTYNFIISWSRGFQMLNWLVGRLDKEKKKSKGQSICVFWKIDFLRIQIALFSEIPRQGGRKYSDCFLLFLYPKQLFESRQRRLKYWLLSNPTGPFTILEAEDQEMGEVYVVQELRATYLEVPKLWKER